MRQSPYKLSLLQLLRKRVSNMAKKRTPAPLDIDISCRISDRHDVSDHTWPMYSFSRPATILWGTAAREWAAMGWTEDEIRVALQSKHPRWSLDGSIGDLMEKAGKKFASDVATDYDSIKKWTKEGA